jgi:hypothetical protein
VIDELSRQPEEGEEIGREVAVRGGKRFVGQVRQVRDWPMGEYLSGVC